MLTTLLIFVVLLGLLIFVHEFGHFIVAKRSGAAVEEFGFGFPPRMVGIKRGNTTYSLNWIPLGGFVRIKGEGGADENDPDSFVALPHWKRGSILVAGVVMNMLLAMVLFGLAFSVGTPASLDDPLPNGALVRDRHIEVVSVEADSPAASAGFVAGDTILTIDGVPITAIDQVQTANAAALGTEQIVMVQRDGQQQTLTVVPAQDADLNRATWGVGLVTAGLVSFPWYQALWFGVTHALTLFWQLVVAFFELIKNLVVHQVVPEDVAGPIGIAALTGQVARLGFVYLLNFAALLSLNLALINILPLPALDGGRLLFVGIEKLRRKRLKPRTEALIHNIGFVTLLALVLLISVRDVSRFSEQIRHFFSNVLG